MTDKQENSVTKFNENQFSQRNESSEGEVAINKEEEEEVEEEETVEQKRVKLFQNLKALQVMFLKRKNQERELEKIKGHAGAR